MVDEHHRDDQHFWRGHRYAVTASNGGITKTYYADLPTPAGATLNLELNGSAGTSHVWLYEANRAMIYSPFETSYDPQSYDGTCVTSPAGTGNTTAATSGFMRVDTEATGTVNVWLRVKTPSTGGALWVSINGPPVSGATPLNIAAATNWTWVKWGQATLAGGAPNGVWFADAIGATELDQVLITDDLSFTP
jgi:hypothetical protein